MLGVYEGEELVYVGRAGTGISEEDAKMLQNKFENIKRVEPPFKLVPKQRANEKITYV